MTFLFSKISSVCTINWWLSQKRLVYMVLRTNAEIHLESKILEKFCSSKKCVYYTCLADCVPLKVLRPGLKQKEKTMHLSPFVSVLQKGEETIQEKIRIAKNEWNWKCNTKGGDEIKISCKINLTALLRLRKHLSPLPAKKAIKNPTCFLIHLSAPVSINV